MRTDFTFTGPGSGVVYFWRACVPALASTSQARDRTQYIVKTLQDHEVFAEQDRQAIAALEAESREPLYLPSIAEVEAQ